MPTRGPALTFDPRYVEFVVHAWQERGLAPLTATDLAEVASTHAERSLSELNAMGLHEEHVSATQISRAINLLKSLKLAKQVTVGPREARVAKLAPTPLGQMLLREAPVASAIRPDLVRHLVASSPELTTLLRALDQDGPVIIPVLSAEPGAPRRGVAYTTAVEEGLAQYWTLSAPSRRNGGSHALSAAVGRKKPTPAQLMKEAQADAVKQHAAAQVKPFDTAIALASALGLVWEDLQQANAVVAARSIGSAAVETDGGYAPNVPEWDQAGGRFIDALIHAHAARADGSGFAPIEALRGALGSSLHIAPSVTDAFLRKAREEGDRGKVPVHLYFVENEDRMYARDRHPLLWQGHAFDFIEVKPKTGSPSFSARTNHASSL
jgi:hypothetical protein